LTQRSPEHGPQGIALEVVMKISETSARREGLTKAIAKLKDVAKLAEASIVQSAALSGGLRNKIKTSMLTSGKTDELIDSALSCFM